jgi:hypothetical protein
MRGFDHEEILAFRVTGHLLRFATSEWRGKLQCPCPAAANCDQKAIKILLDAGISPNCRADADHNLPGSTAPWSFLGSKCQGVKTLEMFISKGYDVNLQNKTPVTNPLLQRFMQQPLSGTSKLFRRCSITELIQR